MASSTSRNSPNDDFTRATTLSQFVSSAVAVSAVSTASVSLSAPVATVYLPVSLSSSISSSSGSPVVSTSSFTAVSSGASALLTSSIHPLRCSALIPEELTDQLFLSFRTANLILSSVGTKYFTGNGSTDRAVFSTVVFT